MFRTILFYLFCILTFSIFAQADEENEEEGGWRNDPLKGTVLLPFTRNYFSVMNSGYIPVKVEKADCLHNGYYEEEVTPKIDKVILTDSTIEIHLRIYENCCFDFLWDPSLSDDGILDLHYISYGDGVCGCVCCFGHVIYFEKDEYQTDDLVEIKEIRMDGAGSYKVKR